jgi:hypothetical protein
MVVRSPILEEEVRDSYQSTNANREGDQLGREENSAVFAEDGLDMVVLQCVLACNYGEDDPEQVES